MFLQRSIAALYVAIWGRWELSGKTRHKSIVFEEAIMLNAVRIISGTQESFSNETAAGCESNVHAKSDVEWLVPFCLCIVFSIRETGFASKFKQ